MNKSGVLSNLVTSAKTTLVHAINETYNRITTLFNQLSTQIGTLSSLTTTNKTNLVSAVNEINGKITNTQIRLNNGKIEYYDGGVWKSMGGNAIAIPSTTTAKILIGSTPISTPNYYETMVMARFISAYDGVIRIVGESTSNINHGTEVAIFKVNHSLDNCQYGIEYIKQSIPFGYSGSRKWTYVVPSDLILVNKAEGGHSNSYSPFNMLVPVEKGCAYLLTMNSNAANTGHRYYLKNVFLQYTITSDDLVL